MIQLVSDQLRSDKSRLSQKRPYQIRGNHIRFEETISDLKDHIRSEETISDLKDHIRSEETISDLKRPYQAKSNDVGEMIEDQMIVDDRRSNDSR